mmetsp:Transcript_2415/g.7166  ORF Transcript_2415/g.7166 Transcript_2415/m.7166 type:complete len:323 (-) Transcript_2415:119-1087(-)
MYRGVPRRCSVPAHARLCPLELAALLEAGLARDDLGLHGTVLDRKAHWVAVAEQLLLDFVERALVVVNAQAPHLGLEELLGRGGAHATHAAGHSHAHLHLHHARLVGGGLVLAEYEPEDATEAVHEQEVPGERRHIRNVQRAQVHAALQHDLEAVREVEGHLNEHEAGKEVANEGHHDHVRHHEADVTLHAVHHGHGVRHGVGHGVRRRVLAQRAAVLAREVRLAHGVGPGRHEPPEPPQSLRARHRLLHLDVAGVHDRVALEQALDVVPHHAHEQHHHHQRHHHPVADARVEHQQFIRHGDPRLGRPRPLPLAPAAAVCAS